MTVGHIVKTNLNKKYPMVILYFFMTMGNNIIIVGYDMAMIGERLKELRESKKLTQEELAKFLNLSQSSIAYYESSKKPKQPSQRTLIKIAKYFNVTLDYLLGLAELSIKYKKATSRRKWLSHKTQYIFELNM